MTTAEEEWEAFCRRYPTKAEKTDALRRMSDGEIDRLARGIRNKAGQAAIAAYKSRNKRGSDG